MGERNGVNGEQEGEKVNLGCKDQGGKGEVQVAGGESRFRKK